MFILLVTIVCDTANISLDIGQRLSKSGFPLILIVFIFLIFTVLLSCYRQYLDSPSTWQASFLLLSTTELLDKTESYTSHFLVFYLVLVNLSGA